ncbi:hypothetical protein Lfu02_75440 [Longispora fulva]|uniref:Uncharacterized protein n=1 Tax=Longispora fulva TaxID=619741 RepID=A0A8J7GP53_9ACTN|nr:hypothetical protein [Longispora fulva]MBG6136319.1 hypothetical protein [Longispora fulva]GIG63172.1 hypothetical protein Lfu02_75440 [Longispora fulva]
MTEPAPPLASLLPPNSRRRQSTRRAINLFAGSLLFLIFAMAPAAVVLDTVAGTRLIPLLKTGPVWATVGIVFLVLIGVFLRTLRPEGEVILPRTPKRDRQPA